MNTPPFVRFDVPWWLRPSHLQTIAAAYVPVRIPPEMPPAETHDVPVAPGSLVRVHLTSQRDPRGTLILLHGLGGCADSPLVLRGAIEAWCRGWSVVRMNFRNCGGTAGLSSTLYNAGMSGDLARVLEWPPIASIPGPKAAIGYSIGGNILLKYLGEAASWKDGEEPLHLGSLVGNLNDGGVPVEDGPGRAGRHLPHLGRGGKLAAAVAVSPPIDLFSAERCLARLKNTVYQLVFVQALLRMARDRHRLSPPGRPRPSLFRTPTMRSYDSAFTAPDAGYASPEEYYRAASSGRVLHRIDTPTLIIVSQDDPIVPASMLTPYASLNKLLRFLVSDRGGHCGWMRRSEGRWTSWLPSTAMDFIEQTAL